MIKALHLASFNGNVGDIANHVGFWNLFKKYITYNVDVTYLEIREFYKSWGLRRFDEEFVNTVNGYDLLVIGGGNFFDVKWDYSRTGTTLDIPDILLEKISVPIVFNGLGVDYNPEYCPDIAKERFESFIQYINSKPDRYVFSLRNDDSVMLIKEYFNKSLLSNNIQIPDGGFFTSAREYIHSEIPTDKTVVAINIAKDRMKDRWGDEERYKLYCEEFSHFINMSLKQNDSLHFVFVPHIPSDLQAISDVLSDVYDYNCRRYISISPYINGITTPGDYIVDLYRKSDLTIGMRYHANICSIAMKTPTIGIVTLNKHIELYKNIGFEDRLFDVNHFPFAENLYQRMISSLGNKTTKQEQSIRLLERLEKESITYYEKIAHLL